MRKPIPILVLFLAVLLAACQSETTPPGGEALATPTATRPVAQSVATGAPAGCTVVSPRPTPGADEQSLFPPVSDEDWTLGPEDAAVTITEYSDFQ